MTKKVFPYYFYRINEGIRHWNALNLKIAMPLPIDEWKACAIIIEGQHVLSIIFYAWYCIFYIRPFQAIWRRSDFVSVDFNGCDPGPPTAAPRPGSGHISASSLLHACVRLYQSWRRASSGRHRWSTPLRLIYPSSIQPSSHPSTHSWIWFQQIQSKDLG